MNPEMVDLESYGDFHVGAAIFAKQPGLFVIDRITLHRRIDERNGAILAEWVRLHYTRLLNQYGLKCSRTKGVGRLGECTAITPEIAEQWYEERLAGVNNAYSVMKQYNEK